MSKLLQSKTTLNFGPRDLMKDTGGSKYALSSEDWVAIQTYAQNGLALPTTNEEFRVYANLKSTDEIPDISDIYDAYKNVHEHCNTWQNSTYPQSVSLASDIVGYNLYVKVYYPKLIDKINEYTDNPTDKVQKELQQIIDSLCRKAKNAHENATAVFDLIKQFANNTGTDKSAIDPLDSSYNKKLNGENGEIATLNKQISDLHDQLAALNKRYNHDVVVAATTPAYAWASIFGFIAAGIVAGTYGADAVRCKNQMDEVQKQINELNDKLNTDINILAALKYAATSLDTIDQSIGPGLKAIEKAQGSWGALNDDLGTLADILKNDIEGQDVETWTSALEVAHEEWNQVAQDADDYRHYAYVDFQR